MKSQIWLILLAIFQLTTSSPSFAADTPKTNEQIVRDYVLAYNKQDIDLMLSMVSDDIQWLNVAGDKINVETRGKDKLREVEDAIVAAAR